LAHALGLRVQIVDLDLQRAQLVVVGLAIGAHVRRLGVAGASHDRRELIAVAAVPADRLGARRRRQVGVVVDVGDLRDAREVMYAARERELAREQSIGALIWGWIKKALVGHGYRLEYALYWSLGLIALGVLVAPRAYKDIRLNWRLRIFFSITMFIPFLEINKRAALERLDDSRAIFFYFIIICGVAIPGMVAAALLGAIG
ncbi:MAG TPA: hypothetical protein PKZ97_15285, partial [Azospirillaceae bacterium]|nr:hypothetical protein [Azospirillaceae bacterium]